MLALILAVSLSVPTLGDTLPEFTPRMVTVQSYAPTLDNIYPDRFARDSLVVPPAFAPIETQRRRAIEFSDAYYTRLRIHKIASYAMIPLFVAQYAAGRQLYSKGKYGAPAWARDIHRPLAIAISGLFVVNTVTGLWNLIDGWKAPDGRTRRAIHGGLMLLADAGFAATVANRPRVDRRTGAIVGGNQSLHRTLAITSMSTALGSYLMMLIWN